MTYLVLLPTVLLLGCAGDDASTGDTGDACPAPTTTFVDADGDGVGEDADCADDDPLRSPLLPETCDDGIDNDCDGVVDDQGAGGSTIFYADMDEDGYGDSAATWVVCSTHDPGSGWSLLSGDCAVADPDIHPGVELDESCDLVDEDCDGSTDEDANWRHWYPDLDSDGWGVWTDWPLYSCEDLDFEDLADRWGDCDDTTSGIRPGVYDPPGGVDADCDGYDD